MEFKKFSKIKQLESVQMSITQKIHGTNAQICIFANEAGDLELKAGSRNRWITPEADNYGFAQFCEENREELIEKLGPGLHYGEWAGPGINSGEGLSEKTFILFNWKRFKDEPLPPRVTTVPVLYEGSIDFNAVESCMEDLKMSGSYLVPGFMRPEGIVIQIGEQRFKQTFESESTQWRKGDGHKEKKKKLKDETDYTYLLQPMRLEKLLSRDESYIREYPESLSTIVRDYVQDLVDEGEIAGDKDEMKAVKKGASGQIFKFVKEYIKENK